MIYEPTTEVKAFFGDLKRSFKLTAPMIIELERVTGAGIGGLAKRLIANEWKLFEVSEIIRLAMIGGGETPENASALIAAYVTSQPLGASQALALTIIEAAFFGADPELGQPR